jgi:hypothetical protein
MALNTATRKWTSKWILPWPPIPPYGQGCTGTARTHRDAGRVHIRALLTSRKARACQQVQREQISCRHAPQRSMVHVPKHTTELEYALSQSLRTKKNPIRAHAATRSLHPLRCIYGAVRTFRRQTSRPS